MATPSAAAPAARPSGPDDPSAPPPGASQAAAPGALGEPAAPSPAPPAPAAPGGPPGAPQQQQQQPSPAEAKYPAGPAQPPPGAAAPPPPAPASNTAGALPQPPAGPQHPGQDDYSFLPLVHDVIKCMDKDSPDVHQVLNELRTKFMEMRKLVKAMQGIGASPEQQQVQLQDLREQVKTKSELLQKYKSLCMFEIPKE